MHCNGLGDRSKVFSGPPVQFLDPPEQVEVRVGQQVRLCCEFRSSSVPVACCWIYNRDKVKKKSGFILFVVHLICTCVIYGFPMWPFHQVVKAVQRVSVSRSETKSSVEISEACPADAGSYTIVVRNREGSANHMVSLSVIGENLFARDPATILLPLHVLLVVTQFKFSADRPDPPASQPVVSQLTSQSLVLSWTGPSYDGGKAVQGYIVEAQPQGLGKPRSWTELATRCKSTSYHVQSGLEPLRTYRFRVRAYNSAGISEPSQESECVKMATTSRQFNCFGWFYGLDVCILTPVFSMCAEVTKQQQQEQPASHNTVTINTNHKVTAHYNVHEKLGV